MYYPKDNYMYSTMLYHCASMVCYILDKCTYIHVCHSCYLTLRYSVCFGLNLITCYYVHFNIYIYNCMLLRNIIKG